MLKKNLIKKLQKISIEEKIILSGKKKIRKEIYTSQEEFVVEGRKFLKKGELIGIKPHTRFTYFPKHRHNYIEMIYMCKGTTVHIINNDEKIFLKEGDILLLNQNAIQEILPSGENDVAVNFIIMPELIDEIFSVIEKKSIMYDFLVSNISEFNYFQFFVKDILPVQNLIENLIWNMLFEKDYNNVIIQFYIKLLFMTLIQNINSLKINFKIPRTDSDKILNSALEYISSNYKDGTLKELSSILGESTYFMSKFLKKNTNYNFKELIQQKKLEKAAYLLEYTDIPIESILSKIGYHNSSFFYRKFKEKYKVTPKNYRLNYKKD